ncbi:sulfotransferase family 2 domain-containing protein [Rhodovibrionaceae bacterium A322]
MPTPPRIALLHYHLFKNAGTSLDLILKENFQGGWAQTEFPNDNYSGSVSKQVEQWICQTEDKVAFSTHTGRGPLPDIDDCQVIPLILVRHPLDRILSAYRFERQQTSESYGAQLAKEEDFAGYVNARLDNPGDRSCRNFHSHRLAPLAQEPQEHELDSALQALAELPWVGLVEAFDQSLEKLQNLLLPAFPDFKIRSIHSNVSDQSNLTLEEKVQQIEDTFGTDFFDRLLAENQDDFVIYEEVRKAYSLN